MDCVALVDRWEDINDSTQNILIEERATPISEKNIEWLLQEAPFRSRAEGSLDEVLASLAVFPGDILDDISDLGSRFVALMQVDTIRVRVEGITHNACKKLHTDFTDLRLITTYAGPGTDYAPHGDGDCCLERMSTGAIGLFKGKLFGRGHTPCSHRSPPIEGTNISRIVLVIDTPEKIDLHQI